MTTATHTPAPEALETTSHLPVAAQEIISGVISDLGEFAEGFGAQADIDFITKQCDALMPLVTLDDEALAEKSFVQLVPDKCDRIVWRGNYYHLPLETVATTAMDTWSPVGENDSMRHFEDSDVWGGATDMAPSAAIAAAPMDFKTFYERFVNETGFPPSNRESYEGGLASAQGASK